MFANDIRDHASLLGNGAPEVYLRDERRSVVEVAKRSSQLPSVNAFSEGKRVVTKLSVSTKLSYFLDQRFFADVRPLKAGLPYQVINKLDLNLIKPGDLFPEILVLALEHVKSI